MAIFMGRWRSGLHERSDFARSQSCLAKNQPAGYNSPVQSAVRVASPPVKPLMIFDGDCHFCSLWVRRWQGVAGERVEFLPFQDPQIAARFPEILGEQFASAVQLIQPDGAVHSGADAVFRTLAFNPQAQWLSDAYRYSPAFARTAEFAYRFVARNRTLFSKLTRLLWGQHLERPSQLR